MDAFVSRKRRRLSPEEIPRPAPPPPQFIKKEETHEEEEESTDVKLAILSSLHPHRSHDDLLEILLSCDGSVKTALTTLSSTSSPPPKLPTIIGMQTALPFSTSSGKPLPPLTKKGRTLHLYSPSDISSHTPCSIIHNFLPSSLANSLLTELLSHVPTYTSATFRLFDNIVSSPHTACFYVDSPASQLSEYLYNGSSLTDIRPLPPTMRHVSSLVAPAVNDAIKSRISTHYPDGVKLPYQPPSGQWSPNAAFVNCYDGPQQSVGYHSDQLSYLGPRAVIGSLSLGVAREFRVRKIVPPADADHSSTSHLENSPQKQSEQKQADIQGQISIHLPHNSLLIMHADMQETWKHSIPPQQNITLHPIAGNKRINITYRWYRPEFHPRYTPRCRCKAGTGDGDGDRGGRPTVLKCVMKRKETRGRYVWMCQMGGRVEGEDVGGGKGKDVDADTANKGCGYFEWAEFTDDGDPIWKHAPRSTSST